MPPVNTYDPTPENMALVVNPQDLINNIICCFKSRVVPYITAQPGVGKSQIVFQIAEMGNRLVIDYRLPTGSSEDLKGFPARITGTNKATMLTYDIFPTVDDNYASADNPGGRPMPINPATNEPYEGWVLFFDELPASKKSLQVAAYKVMLDFIVGQNKLDPRVSVIAAGNREQDASVAFELSQALRSRLAHFELWVESKDWIEWALSAGINPKIISFIAMDSKGLNNFNPKSKSPTFACPRTWELLSRILENSPEGDIDVPFQRVASVIGAEMAGKFQTFCKFYSDMPDFDGIVANPGGTSIADNSAKRYAISHMLASNDKLNATTVAAICTYIRRFERELQANFTNMVGIYNPDLSNLDKPNLPLSEIDKLAIDVASKKSATRK